MFKWQTNTTQLYNLNPNPNQRATTPPFTSQRPSTTPMTINYTNSHQLHQRPRTHGTRLSVGAFFISFFALFLAASNLTLTDGRPSVQALYEPWTSLRWVWYTTTYHTPYIPVHFSIYKKKTQRPRPARGTIAWQVKV